MTIFLMHFIILILITYFQKEIVCKRFYEFFNINENISIEEKKYKIVDSMPIFIMYSAFIIFIPIIGVLFYLGFLYYEKIVDSLLQFCRKEKDE